LFVIEGPHLIQELLASGQPIQLLLYTRESATDPPVEELVRRCRAAGIRDEPVTGAELAEVADTVTPQGMLAVAERPRWGWPQLGSARLLVLDALQDPGNFGTLVRTSEAMGVEGIVALPGCVDPWGPKVTRAAAGSTLRVPIVETDWAEVRARLATAGIEVWAADPRGEPLGRAERIPPGLALVLGNEGAGVSSALLAEADRCVAIPQRGGAESLNVAVAGGILMDRLFGRAFEASPETDQGGR